jgi:hypothetical protein
MKTKSLFFSIVFFLSIFLFLVSCGQQKAKWLGTIENVDGVSVVKNPSKPIYGPEVFFLEEELAIGSKDREDEFIFQYTPNLVVDEEENIYVLDSRAAHIFVFNKQGELVRDFGKKGQGPGEMGYPLDIKAAPHGELMVLDLAQARLNFFSQNGEYLRSFSTISQEAMRRPVINSRGHIVAGFWEYGKDKKTWKTTLKKYNSDLKPVSMITTQSTVYETQVQEYFESRRGINLVWDVTCKDDIIWGIFTRYEIFVHNSEGELYKKIIRDYEGIKITKQEKGKLIKDWIGDTPIPSGFTLKFPERYPPFIRFTCDEEGRIFVQTYDKTEDGEADYYDVFDSEGKYIARISLKYRPQSWKNKRLYTMEEGEDGYQVVKRYKVTWKI